MLFRVHRSCRMGFAVEVGNGRARNGVSCGLAGNGPSDGAIDVLRAASLHLPALMTVRLRYTCIAGWLVVALLPVVARAQTPTSAPDTSAPAAPGGDGAHPLSDHVLAARLTHLTDSLARHGALSGVVLVTHSGRTVFARAVGEADRESRRRTTLETVFNVSSVGKLFTQVAIGQLVASGRLALDSTISIYWPDYPNADVGRRVTVRQLLLHQSGIDHDVLDPAHVAGLHHNRDYLALFVHDTLHFAPGTRTEYSNAGYVVLGELIARVSGEDFYDYLDHHVFRPAGMMHTAYLRRDALPASAAVGYTRERPGDAPDTRPDPRVPLRRNDEMQPVRGSAAGGVYTTAADLLRFARAQRVGTLGVASVDPRIMAGGSPGSNAVVAIGLPGGYDAAILTNVDAPAADAVMMPLLRWLGAPPPRRAAPPPAK